VHDNTSPSEQEEMLGTVFHYPTILYWVVGLSALLIVAVAASKGPSPSRERELLTSFDWKSLAPVPDDVRRFKFAWGARNGLPLDLPAIWARECDAKFAGAMTRIRRQV
jgi:hypothetical protein